MIKQADIGQEHNLLCVFEFSLNFKRDKVNNRDLIFAITRRRILNDMNTLQNQRINFEGSL